MLIINLIGLVLIALVVWWFWLYKPVNAVDASIDRITVVVNNGVYEPSRIKLLEGKKTTLQFLRKDPSPCAASVSFPAFDISEELPIDAHKTIELPSMLAGEYVFHCPMKMYKGTIIVEKE